MITLFGLYLIDFFFRGFSTLAISLPGHGDNFEKGLNSIDDMALYISKIIKKYSSKKIF